MPDTTFYRATYEYLESGHVLVEYVPVEEWEREPAETAAALDADGPEFTGD